MSAKTMNEKRVNGDDNVDESNSFDLLKACSNISSRFSHAIDRLFYRLGYTVASHPLKTIIFSFLITLICSLGYFKFYSEKNPLKLWIPPESKFLRDTEWLMKSMEEGFRLQSVLITAPDVLQPHVLKKLSQISTEIVNFNVYLDNGTSIGWNDVCFHIPNIAEFTENQRRKRSIFESNEVLLNIEKPLHRFTRSERPWNPSVDLNSFIFCSIVDSLPIGCMIQNFLEMWNFTESTIDNLTKQDILNALHTTNTSLTTGHEANFERLLGDVTRNETGHIVAAKGLLTHFMVYVNFLKSNSEKVGNLAGTEDWASEEALLWENEFLRKMHTLKENLSDNETNIYYSAGRSYGDISSATMFQDINKIMFGSALMFIFMILVLSKFGWIELRILLCSMGLMSVGMAFVSAIGLCSFLGISYGPVHTSLPFLLMGLGIDDMFVMMASWKKVQREHRLPRDPSTLPERMGMMLQMAGSSITITSFTDVVAFVIGSITILPSLESFCLYAGVGVVFIFIYVNTFVVAIFTIDEYRIQANRNAFAPCIAHKSNRLWCDAHLMDRLVSFVYTKFIMTKPGKVIVLMTALAVTSYSFTGLLRLEQKFDPNWFIPERTYLSKFTTVKKGLFPDQGYEAAILMGRLNYTAELNHIAALIETIENRTDLVHEISSWVSPFHDFVQVYYDTDFFTTTLSDYDFRFYLSKFLHTHRGGKYRANFRFKTKLECGEPVPEITVSTIDFKYKRFKSRSNYLSAMHAIENIVENAQLKSGDGFATVWGRVYGNWVTDEVIDTEVSRNIMLALACVMFCTTILILNPNVCFWIFMCVVLTLINVCGMMEVWGLTIDLVSCIGLELERAMKTVSHIVPAVLYGGFSTLLAVSMLADSEAYTFQAFFKIFLLVIIFGLFFGLVFLPVILSNEYEITPTNGSRKRRNNRRNESNVNVDDKEMISFIQMNGNGNIEKL
ncbi:patched domain-containing protein 3-like [Contarinia nasturtii]|uniref:patched domain-containing protein 3-like n=1 Tax=Contarinia nasturtii TaxID=265458 RepID=UPI0012D3EBE0|nr:patched domain-containing protein 3-like [Contarinia nasturtii]